MNKRNIWSIVPITEMPNGKNLLAINGCVKLKETEGTELD